MVVLKLIYDIFQVKLERIRGSFDGELASDTAVIYNSGAPLLLAIPFMVYGTVYGLQGVAPLESPTLLLVISWNLDYLFLRGFT